MFLDESLQLQHTSFKGFTDAHNAAWRKLLKQQGEKRIWNRFGIALEPLYRESPHTVSLSLSLSHGALFWDRPSGVGECTRRWQRAESEGV